MADRHVTAEDGKYTVVIPDEIARPYMLRYGQAWTKELSNVELAFAYRAIELEDALKLLTVMARTSGGTAGPDAELMAACDKAEKLLPHG